MLTSGWAFSFEMARKTPLGVVYASRAVPGPLGGQNGPRTLKTLQWEIDRSAALGSHGRFISRGRVPNTERKCVYGRGTPLRHAAGSTNREKTRAQRLRHQPSLMISLATGANASMFGILGRV